MSTRVSVAAAPKPKPKAAFKFLRRDEGRLSYSAVPDSPQKEEDPGLSPRAQASRRDSRSLREAIAQDMRKSKSQDPFSEIVVAVPKKPPPPSGPAPVTASQPSPASGGAAATATSTAAPPARNAATSRRTSSRAPAAASKKPEWVHPEIPDATEETRPAVRDVNGSAGPRDDHGADVSQRNASRGRPQANSGRIPFSDEYDSPNRAIDEPRAVAQCRTGSSQMPSRPSNRFSDQQSSDAFDDVYTEAPSNNYFRNAPTASRVGGGATQGGAPPRHADPRGALNASTAEDRLMAQLEVEVYEAQQERAKYVKARSDLEREQARFENYRYNTQQQFEEERHALDSLRAESQRASGKDVKAMEERYRNVAGLLATERETNRRLGEENDSLRAQLENLTSTMRDMQANHKTETTRLRRDIDSLQKRNSELLAMAKDQQIQALDRAPSAPALAIADRERSRAGSSSTQDYSVPPPMKRPANKKRAAAVFPSEEEALFVAEPTSTPRSGAPVQTQVVMDFSSRDKDDEVKERRMRELEQRMKREEEEMQRRRQQREQEAEERRQNREPSENSRLRSSSPPPSSMPSAGTGAAAKPSQATPAAAAANSSQATPNHSTAAETQKPITPRIRKQPPGHSQDGPTSGGAAAADLSRERKESGHPVHTPRVSTAVKRPASTSTVSARPPIAPKAKRRIPSREELVADVPKTPSETLPSDRVVSENAIGDNPNKRELLYRSGKREIHYANGTVKVVLPSGHTVLHFTNGDVKCSYPSGTSSYWYNGAETLHTQQANGIQIYEFKSTKQTERHMPDGTKEILYPDGIFKIVHPDGSEETVFPDGEQSD